MNSFACGCHPAVAMNEKDQASVRRPRAWAISGPGHDLFRLAAGRVLDRRSEFQTFTGTPIAFTYPNITNDSGWFLAAASNIR